MTAIEHDPGFTVIRLEAENFMRLRAIDITPTGAVTVIEGANAQGKSSVLDALYFALAGGRAQRNTPRPIRDGESKAKVKVTLSNTEQTVIVTRRWTRNGDPGTLTVTDEHGAPHAKPQVMLDALINQACFDPLAYANASAKDQLAGLLAVVKLPFDPDELAAQRQAVYDQRTETNRDIKRLEAQVDTLAHPPADTPDDEVSTQALAEQFAQAQAHNTAVDLAERDFKLADDEVARLEAALEQARATSVAAAERARSLGRRVDTDAITAAMASAETVNAAVRAKRTRLAAVAELDNARTIATSLTAQIEAIDEAKRKALAAADMPLPGLGFDDDGVTYQGVPFAQASGAERLRVSCAMGIAANPRIRTMIVKDGPLLDDDGMALLTSIAESNGFQMLVERVATGDQVHGIRIEDGAVAGVEAPADDVEGPIGVAASPFGWLDEDGAA